MLDDHISASCGSFRLDQVCLLNRNEHILLGLIGTTPKRRLGCFSLFSVCAKSANDGVGVVISRGLGPIET